MKLLNRGAKAQVSRRRFLHLAGGALGAMAAGCAPQTPASEGTALPDYVDGGLGIPVFRGPYVQRDAHIAAFLLPARTEALRALCNTYLNTPLDGAVDYRPLGPYALLLYADMQIQSLDDRDQDVGWMWETEVSFWVPLIARSELGGLRAPDHAAWFLPYLFVDNPYAIASGREVYGFPKMEGHFEKAERIQNPEFAVEVWGFTEFGDQSEGKPRPLLETRKIDGDTQQAPPGTWTNWDAARSALIRRLFKDWASSVNEEEDAAQRFASLEAMPLVFLKQFRDAADSHKACYQAVVEAPVQVETFYGGGFIDAAYALTLHPLASHPLAQTLGLNVDGSGAMQALAVFWLHLDFTLGTGVEV